MAAKIWSGVGVAVQSNTLVKQVITTITKATPGVMTYVGIDPANADYFLISDVSGMYQLQESVWRVANVNTAGNTLELEGSKTGLFETWVTGNMSPLTFGTTLSSAVGITASGGEFEFIDRTTIHDNIRSRLPSVAAPITLQFTCLWDPSDAALVAFKDISDVKGQRAVRLTFADGAKFLFFGYIGFAFIPGGGAQELVTCQVSIEGSGRPTAYAT